MEARGRKSSASLTVVSGGAIQRVEPPAGLSSQESELFRSIVAAKPADWWTEDNAPLLIEYVRGVAMVNKLAKMIELAEDIGELKTLLDMRDKESRRITSLATKMRLAQQSTYTDKSAGTAKGRGGARKLWEA